MAERLYYTDSYLTQFHARVADIREHSRVGASSVWQIALDRTAFYPTSGGQPHDTGTLRATAPSGATISAEVSTVEEDDAGEIWHHTTKPLSAGTPVEGAVDANRRFDHMQQHSGQHLLSAVFLKELSAATVSFHLGEESSTIDLQLENLSPGELERIEQEANRLVTECRPVRLHLISAAQAQERLARGDLRKLPERAGDIRVIEMEGIEWNACGGTHVRNTGAIGAILLRSTERVRGGTRVEFVCGQRAIRAARRDDQVLAGSASMLSTHRSELPAAVQRLQSEIKAARKENAGLRDDLANYHAARLLVEDPVRDGLRTVRRSFADRDAGYVKLLASRLTAAAPQTIALLASTLETPATVVMACSRDVALDCAARLRDAISAHGGRGGGSPTMAQGQVAREAVPALLDSLQSVR